MRKSILLFVLAIIIHGSGLAQESIIPDLSEPYLEKLITIAKANYPHIKSNQNRINVAKGNIGKANISFLDAFTFSYIYQPQGFSTLNTPNQNYNYFNGVQVGLYFNLGNFLEKPYAVKQAKQEFQIANYEQDEYFLTLTNNVKKRYYTYVLNVENLKLFTQSCLDAQNISNDVKHKFEKGEATFDNYTKAQLSLTTSYQSKIQAEAGVLIAKADLEELLGEKLEDIK